MEFKQPNKNDQFKIHAFGKDVLVYSMGYGLILLLGFVQVLLVPRYLSVEGYGYWQLFILYGTYAGILHLGFVDGILLRWAGKEVDRVGNEIRTALTVLIVEQVAVIIPLSVCLYYVIPPPLHWLGLMLPAYAFVMILSTFFMFTAQAVKKFKLLTTVMVSKALAFLIFIVLLFASGYMEYWHVIVASWISYVFAVIVFTLYFRKYLWGEKSSRSLQTIASLWRYARENINTGIFVLFGNFTAILFITLDRLMVSSFFTIEQFATYAFGLSVVIVIYSFVRAISEVFFPYLSVTEPQLRNRAYQVGGTSIILAWSAILILYFPLARLIQVYLPQYLDALPVMRILLCSAGFGSLIQILHVNYYKAYGKQRHYLVWGTIVLVLSAVLNLLAIKVLGNLESVAIAMLLSFGIWYILNELGLRSVVKENDRRLIKNLIIIACYVTTFWFASFINDLFLLQMLIYICLFALFTWLFYRLELAELLAAVREVGWRR